MATVKTPATPTPAVPVTIITPDMTYSGSDIKVYAVVNSRNVQYEEAIQLAGQRETMGIRDDVSSFEPTGSVNPEAQYYYALNEQQDKINNVASKVRDNIENKSIFKELGNVQTLSYSIYRDKQGVNTLGRTTPKGFTRGNATIAGTIIFTVFRERILKELAGYSLDDSLAADEQFRHLRVDQLPPIDLFLTFTNEAGNYSKMAIFGVEFMNEGQVHSVQDLMTENSVNYIARHFSPMIDTADGSFNVDDLHSQRDGAITGVPVSNSDYNNAIEQIKNLKRRWL